MVRSWSRGSPRTISPPTAPQPKPNTESRIPVRPKTRISIAIPRPREQAAAMITAIQKLISAFRATIDADHLGDIVVADYYERPLLLNARSKLFLGKRINDLRALSS